MSTIVHGVLAPPVTAAAASGQVRGGGWRSSEVRLELGMLREILVRAKKDERGEKAFLLGEAQGLREQNLVDVRMVKIIPARSQTEGRDASLETGEKAILL